MLYKHCFGNLYIPFNVRLRQTSFIMTGSCELMLDVFAVAVLQSGWADVGAGRRPGAQQHPHASLMVAGGGPSLEARHPSCHDAPTARRGGLLVASWPGSAVMHWTEGWRATPTHRSACRQSDRLVASHHHRLLTSWTSRLVTSRHVSSRDPSRLVRRLLALPCVPLRRATPRCTVTFV